VSDVNQDTRRDFLGEPSRPRSGIGGVSIGSGGGPDPLSFPRVAACLAPRPELFRRLSRMAAVTVVEALPGLGKTTLIAGWARERLARGSRVVWIRATADLDGVPAFLDVLHRGLTRAGALSPAGPVAPGRRQPDNAEPAWFGELARSEQQVVVVVDDAHLLGDPAVAGVLMRLVQVAHSAHVVICADADHGFHEAAAHHGLETNVLLGGDLGITAEEVPEFAVAWGHRRLKADDARQLHRLVGGWLLPLRLVLDATPSWSDQFATHAADEFLMKHVLPEITDTAELSMSMRFAVSSRLTLDLATALLAVDQPEGCPDAMAEAMGELATATLERRGVLFRVPRHDGSVQWRFPTLMRRVLRDEFQRSHPEDARAAHRVVTRAMLGSPNRAGRASLLRHARAADDWAVLAQLWNAEGWWLVGAHPDAFEIAYACLPMAARQQHPPLELATSLANALAHTANDSSCLDRIETLLRRYMQSGADFLQNRVEIDDPGHLAEMLTAGMVARRYDGRLQEARDLALEAARLFARARCAGSAPMRTDQAAWFHLQWGVIQMLSGDRDLALEKTTTAYELGSDTVVGAGAAALMSAMHSVSGEASDARRWLTVYETIDRSGHWAGERTELAANTARAMLALDRLDAQLAEEALAELPLGPEAGGLWPLILCAHTRHALLFGDPTAMYSRLSHLSHVLARQLKISDGIGHHTYDRCSVDLMLALGEVNRVQSRLSHDVPPWLCIPAARLHLMTNDPKQAARIATASVWRQDIHARDRHELLVINTLAFRSLGRTDRVLESFRHAHALGQHTGSLEPFLLLPTALRAELLEATGLELAPDDLARMDATRGIYPEHADLVQLSPRELEVLRQMCQHDSAAAMARTLSVSVNTVRKQLVSLYAKLGVHDRSSALQRARRLGLLDQPGNVQTTDSGPPGTP
jgi:LuxR family maltose regulon positive regulatory protein